ncbi:MAG TPA: hypothetical protein VFV70_01610 [Hyphomonadaceae bacterium]|nr:hypothetical protein [Hyphomonadaceae bacterium]
MDLHVRILAWIHVILGGVGCTLSLALIAALIVARDPAYYDITAGFAWVLGMATFAYFGPSLVGGIGLLRGQAWARWLIWVQASLLILLIPVGTLLAGYGVWVMLRTRRGDIATDAIVAFDAGLKRTWPVLLAGVAAIFSLAAMIGLGYLFRDYLEPKSDVEILPLPTGRPVLEQ